MAVVVLGFFGASIPLRKIKHTSAQVFEGRNALFLLSKQEGYKRELEKEAKDMELYQTNLDYFILERDKILDFIVELEQLAKNTNNVHSVALSSSGDQKQENSDELFFQVSTRGIFKDIIKFLSGIETLRYRSDIVSLNIQGAASELETANASLTLKINVK